MRRGGCIAGGGGSFGVFEMREPGRGVWERRDVVAGVLGVVDHALEADVGVVGGVSAAALVSI